MDEFKKFFFWRGGVDGWCVRTDVILKSSRMSRMKKYAMKRSIIMSACMASQTRVVMRKSDPRSQPTPVRNDISISESEYMSHRMKSGKINVACVVHPK